jgi:short-subunit dehydrogenase
VSVICPGAVATEFFEARGAAYERSFPRPVSAHRVAKALIRAVETNRSRVLVPRWLVIAPVVQTVAPRLYEPLARRFG